MRVDSWPGEAWLSPPGRHMAIAVIRIEVEGRGIPVICGEQMAFSDIPLAEQSEHLAR